MNRKACEYLCGCDPALGKWIERIGPVKHKPHRFPPFQSLIRAIIHQQLSGKAAGTILQRFEALFPNSSFPSPAEVLALTPERLRGAGLSRGKTVYVRDCAEKALGGVVPSLEAVDRMSDEELIARLTTIKGVGRWTVEMLLIFNLGRPDVLPIHDLSIQKGFKIVLGRRRMPLPQAIEKYGELWKPHRTTASLYLWRASVM
ncbi:MAG: DNA-3-methyladenine glycosylase [Verrucomicrobia subdivision 3 bacterium]|nr:DNA-3-methyladenine glycosylase [Limisphaerales bacterium]